MVCLYSTIAVTHMSTILASVRISARLPEIPKKTGYQQPETTQKNPIPHRRKSIQRGKSDSAETIFVRTLHIWKVILKKEVKIDQKKFPAYLNYPRRELFVRGSWICRIPFGFW